MTDWPKLDAALAGALGSASGADRPLTVFVHVDPEGASGLAAFGVDPDSVQGGIATTTLGAAEIGALSEQPFVRQIRLSSPLRLLDDQ